MKNQLHLQNSMNAQTTEQLRKTNLARMRRWGNFHEKFIAIFGQKFQFSLLTTETFAAAENGTANLSQSKKMNSTFFPPYTHNCVWNQLSL